mgnify:CR=1 FL=1
MKRQFRIRERRIVRFNMDDSRGEFEHIHSVNRAWEVEEIGGSLVKGFKSFSAAEKWSVKNGRLIEIC